MLYERTVLLKKPDELISYELDKLGEGKVTPNMILKDPYILDFLDLTDRYLEKDLEDAILRDIENFILELDKSDIHVAKYMTVLPPKEEFEQKLHKLVANTKLKYQEKK